MTPEFVMDFEYQSQCRLYTLLFISPFLRTLSPELYTVPRSHATTPGGMDGAKNMEQMEYIDRLQACMEGHRGYIGRDVRQENIALDMEQMEYTDRPQVCMEGQRDHIGRDVRQEDMPPVKEYAVRWIH